MHRDDLADRWKYLQEGAALGANLTRAARDLTIDHVHNAVRALDRRQLEAATLAMVLIHAQEPDTADDAG